MSFTTIESTGLEPVNDVLLEDGQVVLSGLTGEDWGSAGGRVRVGQEQGVSSGPITPELVHFMTCVALILPIVNWIVSRWLATVFWMVLTEPISGKEELMVPRSLQASLERYTDLTDLDT